MKRWLVGFCLLFVAGCGPRVSTPSPDLGAYEATCRRVWREELRRPPGTEFEPGDLDALRACIARQVDGVTEEQLRAEVRRSEEWIRVHRPPLARLRGEGRTLVREDGSPFVWRGATAFRLLDHLADGDEGTAVAFLDYLRAEGFNVARVLTMVRWLAPDGTVIAELRPEDGIRVLPRLLTLANERALYVEVVGFAETLALGLDRDAMRVHLDAVGAACVAATNCVVELANENAHSSQVRDLRDGAFLVELRARLSGQVPVSFGSNCCGEPDEPDDPTTAVDDGFPRYLTGGDYLTVHVDRGRDTWNRVRHVRELEAISATTGKFVVSDEPIGAAEADEAGRRSANPHEFFGQGVVARVLSLGATFHFEGGLHARLPDPNQRVAARAFIAGTRSLPDDVRPVFKNARWHDSPVADFRFADGECEDCALRAFTGVDGVRGWVVLVGVHGDPGIVWRAPWRPLAVGADRPGVRVLEITR